MNIAKERQRVRRDKREEIPLRENEELVVQFPEQILVHLIIRIQNITILKNMKRERSNDSVVVVFHDKIKQLLVSCRWAVIRKKRTRDVREERTDAKSTES